MQFIGNLIYIWISVKTNKEILIKWKMQLPDLKFCINTQNIILNEAFKIKFAIILPNVNIILLYKF